MEVKLCSIAKDGLPNMEQLVGRVAFIFDGCIVSGWPLYNIHLKYPENKFPIYTEDIWKADGDVGKHGIFRGVEKYLIFKNQIWKL